MSRMNTYVVCSVISLLVLSVVAYGDPVVVNGSFEDDPFLFGGTLDLGGANPLTGWTTLSNGTYPWGLPYPNIYDGGPTPYGNQWVIVGDYGQGGTWIEQSVNGFTPGQSYTLSFALASELFAAQGALVEVSFPSGSSTASQIFEAPITTGANFWDVWGTFSMEFIADAPTVAIRFEGLPGVGYDAGIDDVNVTPTIINVGVDFKPGSCPNPFNAKSQGVVPVAIVGSADFDVTTVDPTTVFLINDAGETIQALPGYHIDDSTQPGDYDPGDCGDCFNADDYLTDSDGDGVYTYEGDGYDDLILQFDTQELATLIGDAARGDCVELTLIGATLDGTAVTGSDSFVVRTKN